METSLANPGNATLDSTVTAYKIPLSVVAQWPTTNDVNPVRRTWLAPYTIVLAVITTFLLAARFWARYTRQAGNFGLDDLLVGAAWIFSSLFSAAAVYGSPAVHEKFFVGSADLFEQASLKPASTGMCGT